MKRNIVLAGILIVAATAAWAVRTLYTGPLAYESGLAYNQNYSLNVANYGIQTLSATASYSSATVSAQTFDNGTASTGSFTVATVTGLSGKQGTNTLLVASTSSINGSSFRIGGTTLTESIQWYRQATTTATATSIKNAINAGAPQFVASISVPTTRVNIACASSGTWCNTQTLTVVGTSNITAGAATFSGGNDNAIIAINNVAIAQGSGTSKWAVGASSAATGNAIAVAINANTSLSSVITATAPVVCGLTNGCGVVKLTSKFVGTAANYSLYTSSNGAIAVTAPVTILNSNGQATSVMTGGTDSDVALSASINVPANPWYARNSANGQLSMTGFAVVYSTSSGVALSGLSWGTTYFIIPVDYNTIKLASSVANARAGTAITIASSSTQTTANSFALTAQAIAGVPSGKWQVSNDGQLWQDFTTTSGGVAVSSFTVLSYTAGGASTSWDFGNFGYQFIRLAVISPTAGGLNLLVTMNGKGD